MSNRDRSMREIMIEKLVTSLIDAERRSAKLEVRNETLSEELEKSKTSHIREIIKIKGIQNE